MSLAPGARLGPYEIVAPLGAGGMGEVYRARDTKLNRDVAIKVLIAAVASEPDRLARFSREAQVLAALNHPNIAHIYGLEESAPSTGSGQAHSTGSGQAGIALVMELVEGQTLADRIARGAIPIDEVLPIARQIADALDAAHEQGIVHRDLKPANIKVRDDGTVKILDFGLAKALDRTDVASGGVPASVSMSPTLTAATQLGVILGTAAYMSPEQARGKPVDKRADIWAFGAVLYEMLSGKRAFAADEISDTLALVIMKEPDWSALPPDTPPPIHALLRRCLDKDRKRRLADIADARFELEDAARGDEVPIARTVRDGVSLSRALPWGLAGVATLVAAAAVALWAPWTTTADRPRMRLTADFGAQMSLATTGGAPALALSPDASTLVFAGQARGGQPQLYVRRLDQLNAVLVDQSDGAGAPFFSPDGLWIAYFAGGKLKKVAASGGAAITIADAPNPRGGAWAEDGSILFAAGSTTALSRVSAAGGVPEPATTLARNEVTHRWPQILDGGRAMLFTTSSANGQYEDANLVVQPLPGGSPKVVLSGGFYGRYVSSGHIVYIHGGTLFAAPFNLRRFDVEGPSVPIVQGVHATNGTGAAQYSVGSEGTLVYVAGEGEDINLPLLWLDGRGLVTTLRATRLNWGNPQFAPDGRRLAMNVNAPRAQIFVYEWAGDVLSQLTFDAAGGISPVWSPDGKDIVYGSRPGSSPVTNLYVRHADGSGEAVRLTTSPRSQFPASWHPSGKFIAYTETGTSSDLMILPMDGNSLSGWKPGQPQALVAGPAPEWDPAFSPDGRWIAYAAGDSGRPEIYVRPFPDISGGKWKVSADIGGRYPVWSRRDPTIMFSSSSGTQLMTASYTVDGGSFHAEKPRVWGEGNISRITGQRGFDLHPDGTRVVIGAVRQSDAAPADRAVFVFNFFDELRRLAPPAKR